VNQPLADFLCCDGQLSRGDDIFLSQAPWPWMENDEANDQTGRPATQDKEGGHDSTNGQLYLQPGDYRKELWRTGQILNIVGSMPATWT